MFSTIDLGIDKGFIELYFTIFTNDNIRLLGGMRAR